MSKATQTVRIRTHPGMADVFIARYGRMIELSMEEPGTEIYVINRSEEDPDVFFSFEMFDTSTARKDHQENPLAREHFENSGLAELFDVVEVIPSQPVLAVGVEL